MKVAIVGCKGSGKTVLMSVLGVKYEKPDKNGIFLNPKDQKTLHICNENVGRMQNYAQWPLATSPDATECLQWEIMRRVADDPCDTIADLCFLDFAGEVYTGGWGGDNIGNLSAEAKRSLAQLKSHVKEADVLIVLVNLRDIINGQRGDASTDSMEWAARTVLSYAYNEAKTSKVALVFTQSDMYENIIAERGGLQNVLKEYMPNIDARFGDRLELFSVAAVATTKPAPDGGSPLPARGFESKGLEELMLWMADYCLEVRRNELRRMRRKRVRRGFAASIVLLFLLGLFTWKAYNVSPMFRAWVDWQVLAAMELFLPAWVEGSPHPDNPYLKAGEHRNTWVSTRPGYVWEEGTDKIKWEKGLKHPGNEHLKSDEQEGKWKSTKPGWVWEEGTDEIKWKPGLKPFGWSHVTASDNEGIWTLEDGYEWEFPDRVEKGVLSVKWTPGLKHSKWPHVISGVEEGKWYSEDGYVWVAPKDAVDWAVVWKPNMVFGDRKTASKEGEWLTKCNQCDNGEKTVARNVECSNCQGNGTTEIEETCDECNGRGTVTPKKDTLGWLAALERCSSCIDGRTACSWGCRLVNLSPSHSFRWNPYCSNRSAHGMREGNWRSDKELHSVWATPCSLCGGSGSSMMTLAGQDLCTACDGTGVADCFACRGQGNKCKKCSGEGLIPRDSKCGTCEGTGKKLENIQCNVCKGTGEVEKTQKMKCLQCEDGWRRL